MTALGYADLVAAATVGLGSSRLRITGLAGPAGEHAGVLDGDDPAAALLDAVALMTAARRAGVQPSPGAAIAPPAPAEAGPAEAGAAEAGAAGTVPAPDVAGPAEAAPGDPGPVPGDPGCAEAAPANSARAGAAPAETVPELPARAADLLSQAPLTDRAVLADLLILAAGRGYRAPAPMLPALLDAAYRDRSLRPAVAAVLGNRGRWLAGHRQDWQLVADGGPGTPVPVAPAASHGRAGDSRVWETGTRAERRGYLTALREHDPAAARDLLAAGWQQETGDDRADLLAVLARGLSPDDEEFCEQALGDRKESVRQTARALLGSLPGSAFRGRAGQRAAPLLRMERRARRQCLVASLPGAPDAAAIRDGIVAMPPHDGLGGPWRLDQVMPWLLTQIIAAAPLASWVSQFGMDAAGIVSLPFPDGLGADVRAGWRIAAITQHGSDWAQALLAAGPPRLASDRPRLPVPNDHELAMALQPDARMARVAALLAEGALTDGSGVAEVARLPVPWPAALAGAVIDLLRRGTVPAKRGTAAAMLRWPADLAAAAARGLPVTGRDDHAATLRQLAAAGNCPPPVSSALLQAAGTIALRRAFTEEIR